MERFYTILTNVGRAKIANAHANRQALELSIMAVGDGGGAYYNPSEDLTALKNEVYRRELNNLVQDPDNAAYLICEMVIPSTAGGFYVREAGIFDAEGDMIAVGKIPETYKPAIEAGAAKDLYVRFVIEVSNAEAVTLKIDPSVVLATKDMAETAAANAVTVHVGEVNPHGQYLMRNNYTAEDVLNKMKTITGGGEYLNADRLSGVSRETLEAAIAVKQPAGDYATNTALNNGLTGKANTYHTQDWSTILNKPNIPSGGVAPMPTVWGAVGQVLKVECLGVTYTFPAGGTWLGFFIGRHHDPGFLLNTTWCSIVSGGATVNPFSIYAFCGFIWRLA